MKQLSVLIKPASSLCNMRCAYCFYADVSQARAVPSYGVMREETAAALVENVYRDLEDGDGITFAFQGGEPTLAGLAFFKLFAALVARQPVRAHVSWALQTNGLLLNEEWCAFLREHRFLVGLSVDGTAALHNANRLDTVGRGTHARVMEAKRLMDAHRVEYNLLCVLTAEAARHPRQIWKFILEQNVRYIQFIPCLDELDVDAKNPWALTPQRFYSFYTQLFPLWQQQAAQGNYISVKLFDDLAHLFLAGRVTACGLHGQCQPQYIIEADGSVYPCDFYVLDKYRVGNVTEMSLRQLFDATVGCGFLNSRAALPTTCAECPHRSACGGGCKRMQSAMYVDNSGFCGLRALLDERLEALCNTARRLMGR